MPKYAKDFDGYKVTFSGVAYISSDYANSEEEAKEAKEAFLDDDPSTYKELNVDSVEPVDELIFDL